MKSPILPKHKWLFTDDVRRMSFDGIQRADAFKMLCERAP